MKSGPGEITMNTAYILGMAKMEGRVKILRDIDAALEAEDLGALARAA
jgi:purine-binding chemotaxis protein CheW